MPNPFDVLNQPNIFEPRRPDPPSPFDHLNPPFRDQMSFEHTNRIPDRAARDYAGANLVGLYDKSRQNVCSCPLAVVGQHDVGCRKYKY